MTDTPIILATLNAKYIHASLGLRYLYANLGELKDQAEIFEFIINTPAQDIADELLVRNPKIIGFGIYIWNTHQTQKVIELLKLKHPELKIIIGGPEVTYEYENQTLFKLCDYLITGQADLVFASLCQDLINVKPPSAKVIPAQPFTLSELKFPYYYYNEDDIAHRVIYVEASRGCPFKCEFCLSSLDKTAYPFALDQFLSQMDALYQRGARSFKFVDRTFNLKIATSIKILEFFLDRIADDLFLHFELIPDNLPDPLKALIIQFPAGRLQFEIGIQTFTPEVQSLISRKQNDDKAKQNITWLKENTKAHLHTDLIFGLPAETLESFASSFNQLVALEPDEIQLGILKRLRGTPIIRHSETYSLQFSDTAPYSILSTNLINKATIEQITHFARFWDLIANSGRFKFAVPLILADAPFEHFLELSDYLYQQFNRTHSIHLEDLLNAVADFYSNNPEIKNALALDIKRFQLNANKRPTKRHNQRQLQHLQI